MTSTDLSARAARAAAAVTLVLVACLLAVPATAAPSYAAPRPGITLERVPTVVVPGVRITLYGDLTGPAARADRPVVAELRRGGRWVEVARERTYLTGRFGLTVRAPRSAGPVTWRAVAPAVRSQGRLLPRVVSRERTTRVVVQRLRWQLPTTARIGTVVQSRVRLTPFVPHYGVTLQQEVNGLWRYLDYDRVGRDGATFSFTQITSGPSRFRIKRSGGGSPVRTLRGLPSDTVLPTRRVSVSSNGSQLDHSSYAASASDDGRWIAFASSAEDAVRGDSNDHDDVFVKDTATGAVRLVSRGASGAPADGESGAPAVSGDGSRVAFVSRATNLVAKAPGRRLKVFVWERATGGVSLVESGAYEPVTSGDGRYVAFTAYAGDATQVAVRDLESGSLAVVSGTSVEAGSPSISADGRYVAYADDGAVLVWDRTTGATRTVAAAGRHPQLSADGAVVAYEADVDGFSQVYRRDLTTGATTLVSTTDGTAPADDSTVDALSADGSVVLFSSDADLVADDVDRDSCESESECFSDVYRTDAFVADADGAVTLVSRGSTGAAADIYAEGQDLLADGSRAVFVSRSVLVPGQTSRSPIYGTYIYRDVFVRDLAEEAP